MNIILKMLRNRATRIERNIGAKVTAHGFQPHTQLSAECFLSKLQRHLLLFQPARHFKLQRKYLHILMNNNSFNMNLYSNILRGKKPFWREFSSANKDHLVQSGYFRTHQTNRSNIFWKKRVLRNVSGRCEKFCETRKHKSEF